MEYFSLYTDDPAYNFQYHDDQTSLQNFRRLSAEQGWGTATINQERQEFQECLLEELEAEWDVDKLEVLQEICELYGHSPPPPSITKCRTLIRSLYVNIYDFAEGAYVDHGSYRALRKYSIKKHKVFPKQKAKENKIYKLFMRELFHYEH